MDIADAPSKGVFSQHNCGRQAKQLPDKQEARSHISAATTNCQHADHHIKPAPLSLSDCLTG